MPKKHSYITATDQFCGAGGSSQGATKAGVKERGCIISNISPVIEDCYYRMLKPNEIKLAMAFDKKYIVLGSGKNQVRQLGNAVTPPVMEWLVKQIVESLK